jgi:Bacitracin resistance protein BacA
VNNRKAAFGALFISLLLAAAILQAKNSNPPGDHEPAYRPGRHGAAAFSVPGDGLGPPKALLRGAAEGMTDYLPVSSTGHLLVVGKILILWQNVEEKSAADSHAVVMQLGAIFAVLVISLPRIRRMALGLVGRASDRLRLLGCLVLAFIPADFTGFHLEDSLKRFLFNVPSVAAA